MTVALLKGASTLHSIFKLQESSSSKMFRINHLQSAPNSAHGKFLVQIKLFLLDKATMTLKLALHAFFKLLQDVCCNMFPFGRKVVLFGGDFKLILLVVRRGQPVEIIKVFLKSSPLWL